VLIPTLAAAAKDKQDAARVRAERLLNRVGLAARKLKRPGQLSGGERQRAAVVRALINEPPLLLADEPTGSLDRAAAENLRNLLIALNRGEGVALIVATHSMELARGMGRVYEIRDGSLHEVKF
jgi:ABC-type lipoprotein export system ATPase subunit